MHVNVNLCGVLKYEGTPPISPSAEARGAAAAAIEDKAPEVVEDVVIDADQGQSAKKASQEPEGKTWGCCTATTTDSVPVVVDLSHGRPPDCVTIEGHGSPPGTAPVVPVSAYQQPPGTTASKGMGGYVPHLVTNMGTELQGATGLDHGRMGTIPGPTMSFHPYQATAPMGPFQQAAGTLDPSQHGFLSVGAPHLSPISPAPSPASMSSGLAFSPEVQQDAFQHPTVVKEVYPSTPASVKRQERERPLVTSKYLDHGGQYDFT